MRPQDCGEGGPVAPEQEKEKGRDDERERKPFGGEEDVEQDDVHYDRSEDGEAERHEAAEDQEKATNDLASGDSIKRSGSRRRRAGSRP